MTKKDNNIDDYMATVVGPVRHLQVTNLADLFDFFDQEELRAAQDLGIMEPQSIQSAAVNVHSYVYKTDYIITRVTIPRMGFIYSGIWVPEDEAPRALPWGGHISQVLSAIAIAEGLTQQGVRNAAAFEFLVRKKEGTDLSDIEVEHLLQKVQTEVNTEIAPLLKVLEATRSNGDPHEKELQAVLDVAASLIDRYPEVNIHFRVPEDI